MAHWFAFAVLGIALTVTGCSKSDAVAAGAAPAVASVGTAKVETRPLAEHLTVSSELVPYQEIDVYAKEAGYVKDINVDYGSHVHKGQVMAILEVPEPGRPVTAGRSRHQSAQQRSYAGAERGVSG